jgi:hypothetical protein
MIGDSPLQRDCHLKRVKIIYEEPMKKLIFLFLAAILMTPCQGAATSQTPPTELPAPTPTSAPVEISVSSVNDLLGVWWFSSPGVKLELKADGTFRLFLGDTTIDEGIYSFDNGKVTWVASTVCKPATYEAYITRQDGAPIWLRMQVVGSDSCHDRADVFNSKGKYQNP